jgi:signal transduction histidine kinase/CheY-like chemotaxis protein
VQKNGTELDLEINASVIQDSGGRVNTVAQILDITERKKLEGQFRQVQKMEAIGQLAGGIAHDFNNILTVINGYAEIGLKKVERNHPIRLYLYEILKSGKRAEKFTRQLLGFSRKQLIELKSLKINEILMELGTMLRRLIGEDIEMVTKFGKDIALIKADPGQIEQILVNLVVNARDAINFKTDRAAKKKIIIETDHKYLDESYVNYHAGSRIGQHVVLSVSDTGVGMNLSVKNRIFEPFFTTKGREKGTGLGLSTVYGIVKQNNGSIYVYSEPNKGTTVKIYWPSEMDKSTKPVQRRRKSDLAIGTENILIAEDDEGVKSLVSDALTSLGYTVYSASNGVEALKLLRSGRKKVNLLITDIIMPEMGGKELVENIISVREDLKVLFTSGYTDAHIVRQGILEAGINFIQKPYSIQALAKKVREVLDQA